MKLVESFIIALQSLQANKLRSILTMLGIIIGVGAVISLMSLGRGAEATVASTFPQLGANIQDEMTRSSDVSGMAGLMTSSPSWSSCGAARAKWRRQRRTIECWSLDRLQRKEALR